MDITWVEKAGAFAIEMEIKTGRVLPLEKGVDGEDGTQKKDKSLHGQFFQETKAEAAGVIRKEKGRSER